jgi:hypothetical protein
MSERQQATHTTGEIIALIAPVLNRNPEDLLGYVIVGAVDDDSGASVITASNASRKMTISLLLHAAERLADTLTDELEDEEHD